MITFFAIFILILSRVRTVEFSRYDLTSEDVITLKAYWMCTCVFLGFLIFQYMIYVTSCDSIIISK